MRTISENSNNNFKDDFIDTNKPLNNLIIENSELLNLRKEDIFKESKNERISLNNDFIINNTLELFKNNKESGKEIFKIFKEQHLA